MILEEIRTLAIRGSASPACRCKAIHTQIRAIVEKAMEVSGGSLFDYIDAQKRRYESTFGKEDRTSEIVKDIADKLDGIFDVPSSPYEWADIISLAIDGAISNSIDPDVLSGALLSRQAINARQDEEWL